MLPWLPENQQTLRGRAWRLRFCSDRAQIWNLASQRVYLWVHRTKFRFSDSRYPLGPLIFGQTEKITKIEPKSGHVTGMSCPGCRSRNPQKPSKKYFWRKKTIYPQHTRKWAESGHWARQTVQNGQNCRKSTKVSQNQQKLVKSNCRTTLTPTVVGKTSIFFSFWCGKWR